LDDDTFGTSAFYNLPNLYGFANMSSAHQGAPIFFSQLGFYGAPPEKTLNLITGVNVSSDVNEDISHTYVEPYTGKVMMAEKRIQVNVHVRERADQDLFYLYFPNVRDGIFYPIFRTSQHAEVNSDQAKEWKDKVEVVLDAREVLFWITMAVGIVMFVTTLPLLCAALYLWRTREFVDIGDNLGAYHAINRY